jgi:diguanylate cyclase (GGDEF)-like protein
MARRRVREPLPPVGEELAFRRAAASGMAKVRLAGAVFVTVQALLYQPPAGLTLPFPWWALPLCVVPAVMVVSMAGAAAARHANLRVVRFGARAELAADAAIMLGVIFAFSFDHQSQLWAMMVLPVMEAAWRERMSGALLVWAGMTAGYTIRDYWAAHVYDYIDVAIESITYRSGLVLTVTLIVGLLASSMHRAAAALSTANTELARQARTDSLTGLGNRDHFLAELGTDLRQRRSGAVAFFDIDNFKTINDSLGHTAGDFILTEVGARLSAGLRDGDVVARFGGDEFTALLRDVDGAGEALDRTHRLQEALKVPVEIHGRRLTPSMSAGLVIWDDTCTDASAVLSEADLAMYEAKRRGRGSVMTYTSTMATELQRRMTLEQDLPEAVERWDLGVAYQPIVHALTGRPAGFEALLRWTHPTHGQVPPMEVMQLANELGLGEAIGRRVVETAVCDLARWRSLDPELFVTVNFGLGQVSDAAATATHIDRTLRAAGLPQQALVIEVTETAVVEGADRALDALLPVLRGQGVRVAIDDFGQGYSSLSRLSSLTLDVLKLDRGFVTDCAAEHRHTVMLEGLVRLAHDLGLDVVAEGVETAGEQHQVREVGCDMIQGFAYARPGTADAATHWLQECTSVGHGDQPSFDRVP